MNDSSPGAILFVCTGNTCRSPMAGALARRALGAGASVETAGLAASVGAPATPEAVEAVRRLGAELRDHSARQLTREILDGARTIYVMTHAHAHGVLRIDPAARDRVELLDPAGADIDDPIGGPQSLYDDVARRLDRLIRLRLKERVA